MRRAWRRDVPLDVVRGVRPGELQLRVYGISDNAHVDPLSQAEYWYLGAFVRQAAKTLGAQVTLDGPLVYVSPKDAGGVSIL